ncbi:MAG TPA: hypothetical protein VLS89_06450 [Candidatus Nanopelagicales bacterium]|nr:hypothetical protein [Candidatus Nanopelagicales bacterium]
MHRLVLPDLADDPVWQAILRAPSEDETPEEALMVERAKALGGSVPAAKVTAGLSVRRSLTLQG